MSELAKAVGKGLAVAGIAITQAVGSTVDAACKIAPDIGKATCDAGKGAATVAKEVAAVVAKRS